MTTVEQHQAGKVGAKIAIKPFFNPSEENMGLERYGMSLFDNVFHQEQLACLEVNGVIRYLTGLNEFAPEIRMITNAEEKAAKIAEIRAVVSDLEKTLASNIVDPKDEKFWEKVTLLHPNNVQFWDKVEIRLSNEPKYLEPNKDPNDLILLKAIEAGGFSIVAKSLDAARAMSRPPKFYLDKQEDTAAIVTEVKKLKAKAMGILQRMYDSQQNKMFLVAKVVDVNSMQYKKSTPNDVIYDNLFEYIEGNRVDRDKRKCAQKFIDAASLESADLKIRAMIKDGTYLKLVHTKGDGYIYHMATMTPMGKNPSDVVEFLKNQLNEEILKSLSYEAERYWNL